MPIYEYRCQSCHHQLEAMQKISDSPLTDCPNCGKNTLEKIISPTQFQLKGTGWYVTDFKNGSAPKKEEKTNTEAKTTDSSAQKTEDKKPPSDQK